VPQLLARAVFSFLPALADAELVVLINTAVIYFGAYLLFAMFWKRLRHHFRNPFLAALTLWLANVLLIMPVLGKGILGYKMPQGWFAASLPLLVSHWMFARGLQFQDRRS